MLFTEDERVGWHHPLDGHEFEQAPGVGDGQGSLICCNPWGCKETRLNDWTELTDALYQLMLSSILFILCLLQQEDKLEDDWKFFCCISDIST